MLYMVPKVLCYYSYACMQVAKCNSTLHRTAPRSVGVARVYQWLDNERHRLSSVHIDRRTELNWTDQTTDERSAGS